MDKVFSARLDETILDQLTRASRRLGISKKRFLEEAIRQQAGRAGAADVWAETCGAWHRREPPATTIRKTRRAFERGMQRHHRSGR